MECEYRAVREDDATAIAAIYAHHVLHGMGTFDTVPVAVEDWRDRIAGIVEKSWPFLVAHAAGRVVGYAYAAQFRDREAYRTACEDSIYIAEDARGLGVGAGLLTALIAAAPAAGFREMVAVIGGPEPASVALHARLGFTEAGRLRNVGIKFGRSLDVLFMQRSV